WSAAASPGPAWISLARLRKRCSWRCVRRDARYRCGPPNWAPTRRWSGPRCWPGSAMIEATIAGKLIVSCQAGHGHPLRDTATISRLARAAVAGGAAAIRCGGVGGVADVAAVVDAVD